MILEGLLTTVGPDGQVNIAPMGAVVDDAHERAFDHLVLRPYQVSASFANLKRTGQAVFHVTDDVEMLARAAVDRLEELPDLVPTSAVDGFLLLDACRWYALRVRQIDDSRERAEIEAEIVDRGWLRDFFGLSRAKHAVVEAAILATRTAFLPADEIRAELARLGVLVEKTGGPRERRAFRFLQDYVEQTVKERC